MLTSFRTASNNSGTHVINDDDDDTQVNHGSCYTSSTMPARSIPTINELEDWVVGNMLVCATVHDLEIYTIQNDTVVEKGFPAAVATTLGSRAA